MKPHQYQQLLSALDHTLELFDAASANFSVEDLQLRLRIAQVRSQVLMVESGHPFTVESSATNTAIDPDLTPAPWTKLLTSDPHQVPPAISG